MPGQSDEWAAEGILGVGMPDRAPGGEAHAGTVGGSAVSGAPQDDGTAGHGQPSPAGSRPGDGTSGRADDTAGGRDRGAADHHHRPAAADRGAADPSRWELFRRMAMSCPLPVFATDAVGRHVFVNPRWSELTGVEPDEALGWGWERAIHPHDLLTVTNQWGRAQSDGDGLWVRLRLLRPDGLHRAAILQAVPTGDEPDIPRFVGTLTPLPPLPAPPLSPLATPGLGAGTPTADATRSGPSPSAGTDVPVRLDGPRHDQPDNEAARHGEDAGQAATPVPVPRPRTGEEPPPLPAVGHGALGAASSDADDRDDETRWDGVNLPDSHGDGGHQDRGRGNDHGDSDGDGDGDGDGEVAGAASWDDALGLAGQDDAEAAGLVAGLDERGAGRPQRNHLAWDGNRRRAAAPDGGDSWPSVPDKNTLPALGGEWRAAIALHGRGGAEHASHDVFGNPGGAGDGEQAPDRRPPGIPRQGLPVRAPSGRPAGGQTARPAPMPHFTGPAVNQAADPAVNQAADPAAGPVSAGPRAHGGGHRHSRVHAQAGGQGHGSIDSTGRGHTGDHGPGRAGGHGSGMGDGGHGRSGHLPPAECGCLYGELARAEAACRDRERWLTSLLAELPAAVLLADAQSQVVGVNQAYCDLFDLAETPVDLVGTDCRLLLRPRAGLVDDPAGFADRLDTLLRRRRTLRRETVMFADGRVFERSHLPLVSPDGYRGHLWLYVDVTDRRILDAEIEGLISEL